MTARGAKRPRWDAILYVLWYSSDTSVSVVVQYYVMPCHFHFIKTAHKNNQACIYNTVAWRDCPSNLSTKSSAQNIVFILCIIAWSDENRTEITELTSSNPHDSHDADDRRVDRNKYEVALLQYNPDNGQNDNGDVQLIPPASSINSYTLHERFLRWPL